MVVAIAREVPGTAALTVGPVLRRKTIAASVGARERIMAAYAAGDDVEEIAPRVGFCVSAIWCFLRREGIEGRPRGIARQPECVDRIVALYGEGHNRETVARMAGVAPQTVTRALRGRGIRLERRRAPEGLAAHPELEQRIVELYESGLSLQEVSGRVPATVTGVRNTLRRRGVQLRPPHITYTVQRVPDAYVERMVELYESGLTVEQVGERVGRSGSTVNHHLRHAGVQMRGSTPIEVREEVLRLKHVEGMRQCEIAERLGLCPSTVSRVVNGRFKGDDQARAEGGRLPGEPFRRWLRETAPAFGGITAIARRARVDDSQLGRIASGRHYDGVTHGFVDRVLTRLGRPELVGSLYPDLI